jgi:hypothetical protein
VIMMKHDRSRRSRTSYDQHLEEELLGGSLCLLCFPTGHLVLASGNLRVRAVTMQERFSISPLKTEWAVGSNASDAINLDCWWRQVQTPGASVHK